MGDKPGHAYAVDQINCTPTKGDIDGAKRKSGTGTEFIEVNGDKFTGHGEFIETMENGDKNFYTYQMTGTLKNGVLTGSDKWSLRPEFAYVGMRENGATENCMRISVGIVFHLGQK